MTDQTSKRDDQQDTNEQDALIMNQTQAFTLSYLAIAHCRRSGRFVAGFT